MPVTVRKKRQKNKNSHHGSNPDGLTRRREEADPKVEPCRGRRLRRFLIAGMAFVLLVWLAPMIVGYTPLRNYALASLAADLKGSITASSASLGWFSPITLYDVEIRDEQDALVLRVPTLRLNRSLRQLLTASSSLGCLELHQPRLHLTFDRRGSNLQRVLAPLLESDGEPTLACPAIQVKVIDGAVVIKEADADAASWQIQQLQAELELQRDWSQPMALQVAGNLVQPYRAGQFDVNVSLARVRGEDGKIASRGAVRASTSNFPLAMLGPLFQRLSPGLEVTGWVSGEADYAWGGAGPAAGRASLDVQLRGENIEIHSPALGREALRLEKIQLLPSRIVLQNQQLRIEKFAVNSEVGQAALDGELILDLRRGLGSGLVDAMRRSDFEFKGSVDLAQLAQLLPEMLSVREGTKITSGGLELSFARREKSDKAVWSGHVASSSLRAINQGRPVTWENPIRIEFTVEESTKGLHLQSLQCQSDFISLRAQGQPESLTVWAEYDLDRLASRLGEFFDLRQIQLAGSGWSRLEWKRQADARFEVWFESQIDRFALRFGGRSPWSEESVNVQAHLAVTPGLQGQEIETLSEASLRVTSGGDRLQVELARPVQWKLEIPSLGQSSRDRNRWAIAKVATSQSKSKGRMDPRMDSPGDSPPHASLAQPHASDGSEKSGFADQVWPLEIDMRGDVGRWLARLEPLLGPQVSWQLAGDCQALASLDLSSKTIEIHRSRIILNHFRAAGPGWLIEEPSLELNFVGTWHAESRKADILQLQAFAGASGLDARKMTIALPKDEAGWPEFQGDLYFKLDLAQIQRWRQSADGARGGKATMFLAGKMSGLARLANNAETAAVQLEAHVKDLNVQAADSSDIWHDSQVSVVGDLRYERGSGVLQIRRFDVESRSHSIECRSQGRIAELSGRRIIDLRGNLIYDMQKLAARLFPSATEQVQIVSRLKAHPFRVQGPLAAAEVTGKPFGEVEPPPLIVRLNAQTQTDWIGVNVYGFHFAAGEIRARLQHGQVYFDPLNLSVNNGRLTAKPQINLIGSPPTVILKAGKLLDHVRITPEMCNLGLKFALPALYGVSEAQGTFSVNIQGCRIPLNDPSRGTGAGEFIVHDVQVAPGPLLKTLAQSLDAIRIAAGKAPRAAAQLRTIRLKRESIVEFWMNDGRMHHRNLELDFGGTIVRTNGSVGLDQSIQLTAKISAPKLFGGKPLLAGVERTEISIPISGTLDRPRIDRSRLGDTLRRLLGGGLMRTPTAEGIGKELKKRAGDLFRGFRFRKLFGADRDKE